MATLNYEYIRLIEALPQMKFRDLLDFASEFRRQLGVDDLAPHEIAEGFLLAVDSIQARKSQENADG